MNSYRFRNSSEVVFKLLFLCLVNFDSIFGCLSVDYSIKETLIPVNNPAAENEIDILELWKDQPNDEELTRIKLFTKHMSRWDHYKFNFSDWEFIWMQLKEFTRIHNKRRQSIKQTSSNTSSVSIGDIETYLNQDKGENVLIGVHSVVKGSHVNSIEQARYYYKPEMDKALLSAKHFHYSACTLRNVTFCMKDYLNAKGIVHDIHQILPPGFALKRCPRRCACLQENEQCLPTGISHRFEYALTINDNSEKSTWPLALIDHTGCKCKDKCKNRKCIQPFVLQKGRHSDCQCVCPRNKLKICSELYEGKRQFSDADYQCIANGTCITPKCRAGHLSEENFYRLTCPKVLY